MCVIPEGYTINYIPDLRTVAFYRFSSQLWPLDRLRRDGVLGLSKSIQITVGAVVLYILVESERMAIYFAPAQHLADKPCVCSQADR